MATITVRDLPDDVQRRLKQRAVANDRSMEAEARAGTFPDSDTILAPGGALRGFLVVVRLRLDIRLYLP